MRFHRYRERMLTQVEAALAAAEVQPCDAAAAELALTYARDIDNGGDLTKLGPALLATLDALGLTPRARKAVKTDGQQPAANPLDQLAERRAGRGRPQAVDAAAP
jgi:hypothetical protein